MNSAALTIEPPESLITPQDEVLFHKLDTYPWDSDEEYQAGLRGILGPNPNPTQAESLNLRARCYYYSLKHAVQVDFNRYQAWHARQGDRAQSPVKDSIPQDAQAPERSSMASPLTNNDLQTATQTPNGPPAPYPTNFEHIVNLITTGQPIPGIRDIPDTVLQGQASQATTAKRKKPWENNPAEELSLSSVSGIPVREANT